MPGIVRSRRHPWHLSFRQPLPHLENDEWFFDAELLLLAEERGYRVYEVPVAWIEDLYSRIKIVSSTMKDVKVS